MLLTSTFASVDKIERLRALRERGLEIACVIDHAEVADRLASAMRKGGVAVDVLLDLDMGRHRAGVATVEAAKALAERLATTDGVRLRGIQAYAGHMSHMRSFAERGTGAVEAAGFIDAVLDGLPSSVRGAIKTITGSSTGALLLDIAHGRYNELQCGSYIVMDTEYEAVDVTGQGGSPFEPALFLRTSVISANHLGRVTTDGGDKRLASKYGVAPRIVRGCDPRAVYRSNSDEHGSIELPPGVSLPLGAAIECVVPHCDPTINLFDVLHVVEDDTLVDIWPIEARGA